MFPYKNVLKVCLIVTFRLGIIRHVVSFAFGAHSGATVNSTIIGRNSHEMCPINCGRLKKEDDDDDGRRQTMLVSRELWFKAIHNLIHAGRSVLSTMPIESHSLNSSQVSELGLRKSKHSEEEIEEVTTDFNCSITAKMKASKRIDEVRLSTCHFMNIPSKYAIL